MMGDVMNRTKRIAAAMLGCLTLLAGPARAQAAAEQPLEFNYGLLNKTLRHRRVDAFNIGLGHRRGDAETAYERINGKLWIVGNRIGSHRVDLQ